MQIINNYRCKYEYNLSSPDADNIIFLNGILNNTQSWQSQVELVQSLGFNALTYDYRGQWYSQTTPEPYSLELLANDLVELMNHCSIEKAHLVGTSYGGFVMQKFISMFPQKTLSAVIITSSPIITGRSRHIVNNWCYFNSNNDNLRYYDSMLSVIFSEKFFSDNAEALQNRKKSFGETADLLPDFAKGQYLLNKASLDDLDGKGLLDSITKIKVPTHVVAAGDDIIYPPKFSKMIAEKIPGAIYTKIPDSGHAIVMEKGEVINQILQKHLSNRT
ncbi:MAG: alpha/beta hydrolase [Gammaproteobacteria bacterium]|nr:MAG: alpha/beta hydrolase [Gammaproteobacteria bacterium]